MKKLFISFAVVVMAVVSQACASVGGYTGFTGVCAPGFEAACVTSANAAMPYQILAAAQPGWIYHGQPSAYAPAGYQWVCRPVSMMHELKDVGYAALGLGSFLGWRGVGGGAGVAGYAANHERDCYLQSVQSVQSLNPFLVRVVNTSQAEAVLFDGIQQIGIIPGGRQADVPPATNGYRAMLMDSANRLSEAEVLQPDPQKRFLEIRPRSP